MLRLKKIALSNCRQLEKSFASQVTIRQTASWRLRGLAKRRFSSNAPPAEGKVSEELTTDEKAAFVGKSSWPTLKKYSPIIIPTVLAIIITIDIINNPFHRMLVESVFPAYVELVRRHYGFVDEDESERQRIKWVSQQQMKPVRIRLNGSNDIIEIDASRPVGEVLQQLFPQSNDAEGCDGSKKLIDLFTQFQMLQSVEFVDSVDELNDSITQQQPAAVPVPAETVNYLSASSWNATPPVAAEALGCRSLREYRSQVLDAAHRVDANSNNFATMLRCESFVVDTFDGLHQYIDGIAAGRQGITARRIPIRLMGKSSSVMNQQQSIRKNDLKKVAAEEAALRQKQRQQQIEMLRSQAKHEIQTLEAAIMELQRERITGVREIDEIDAEIRSKQEQITALRRQRLNYFYFF